MSKEIKERLKPSKYAERIFAELITTSNNIAVSATAGAGKTTTLVEMAKLLPYGKKSIFIAFNRHIVKELKERLPEGIPALTMHSLGAKCIGGAFQNGWLLKETKQIGYLIPYFEGKGNREKWPIIYQLDRVMQLMRATMTPLTKEGIEGLIEKYALDVEEEHGWIALKALRDFYNYNDYNHHYRIDIDFTDQIEMCVRNKEIQMPQYDYVLIDEAADMSTLDRAFLNRIVKQPRGRKIIVGDKNQAIYSFRGTDIDSFQQFASERNTVTLPLSISYRCAKSIVKKAQEVYKDGIEEWEESPEGIVRKGKVEEIDDNDIVLCRNTRPLIDVFFRLIEADKKAYIVGRDSEKGLLKVLAAFDSDEKTANCYDKLKVLLSQYYDYLKNHKKINNPLNNAKYTLYNEKIEILRMLFSKFNTIREVENFISEIFDDEERQGIMLCTIHKAKGLESNRVFFIETYDGTKLIPSQYAITADQLKQEKNLLFVAITRCKKELVYLNVVSEKK